jgi:YkoY family integral membrane protein
MEFLSLSHLSQEIAGFSSGDGLAIATLALLEGILSVDNSLVLAILVRNLPKERRNKALSFGIGGAFAFRIVALILAAHLLRFSLFKLVGGAYLIYLAMKHMFFFFKEDAHQPRPKVGASFWMTVLLVELTDIAFSIDSITAAVAMSNKLIVVWSGGILGIVFLRFAAGVFIRLLERLPKLEDLAYQLIFFVGTKLLLESFHIEIGHAIFWLMMGVIVILGAALVYRDHYQRKTESRFQNRLLQKLKANEMTVEEVLALEYIPGALVAHLIAEGVLTIRTGK